MSSLRIMTRNCLLLSVLMHLLLLASLSVVWVNTRKPFPKPPSMYVPSYAYQEPASTNMPSRPLKQQKSIEKREDKIQKPSADSIAIPNVSKPNTVNQVRINQSKTKTEAIHLVGDKKVMPKPLIKLLGKALTARLLYPKIAADFRVKGISYIGFLLHPDGSLTEVKLVQSSNAGVLDNEALDAVRSISPVKNVSPYVDKTRYMVVGIIFN